MIRVMSVDGTLSRIAVRKMVAWAGGSSHPGCPFRTAPHAITAAVCCWHRVGPLENGQQLLSLGPVGCPAIVWLLMTPSFQEGVPIGPMCSRLSGGEVHACSSWRQYWRHALGGFSCC